MTRCLTPRSGALLGGFRLRGVDYEVSDTSVGTPDEVSDYEVSDTSRGPREAITRCLTPREVLARLSRGASIEEAFRDVTRCPVRQITRCLRARWHLANDEASITRCLTPSWRER